jgi:hypothetical protein
MFLVAMLASATPATARTVSYAVIVGNNAPPSEPHAAALSTLRYADDDAVRYYQLLSQFSRTTLLATLDDATQKRHTKIASLARVPSLEALRQVFASLGNDMRLDREAGNEPVLYFVFSGHGALAESGDAFLALADGRLTQRILFDELIGSLPTPRTHLIVDACHAAGVVGARGGKLFGSETTGATAEVSASESIAIAGGGALERHPNVGVMAATTLGNETHEWSAIEAGVFSHEVLSGLAGPADINGDQTIEYSELHAFVANANRSISNPRAVPIVISQAPRAHRRAPIVRLPELRGSYLLQGNVGAWGRFSIELADGQRLIDAHISRERDITVALPVGQTVYVRTAGGEAKVISRGKRVAVNDLRLAPPTVARRSGSVDADYRQHLFASPYGPTYYRGFVEGQGLVAIDFDVQVRVSGTLVDEPAPEPRASPWPRIGGYALLTTSMIFGTVAIVAGVEAYGHRSNFHDATTRSDAEYDADEYRTWTTVFWSTAAVSALAGVGSWKLFGRANRIQIAPQIDPRTGAPGLSFQGSF